MAGMPFQPPVPRGASFGLYPHIHGNYLNTNNPTLSHNPNPTHNPSLSHNTALSLGPKLYDLHTGGLGGSKLPVKLDPSLPDSIYRFPHPQWEPMFDRDAPPNPFSGEPVMLPTVPLENLGFVDKHSQTISSSVGVPSHGVFKPPSSTPGPVLTTTQPMSHPVPVHPPEELLRAHCQNPRVHFNYHPMAPTSSMPSLTGAAPAVSLARSKGQAPTCPRPLPLGGNASIPGPKVESPVLHCKMHSAGLNGRSLPSHLPSGTLGAASQAPGPAGAAVLSAPFRKQQPQHVPLGVPGYPCQHAPPSLRPPLVQTGFPPPPSLDQGMAGGAGNVSVGTSTGMCQDPDCDGHHDDNCDSGDDSSSEKSTSTNTSNQKEGKYCDCCYCEFFGHGSVSSV